MSRVIQALREAMGEDFVSKDAEKQLAERAGQLKSDRNLGSDDEGVLEALKEAYGTGVISPNLQMQLIKRANALESNPKAAPLGSGGGPKEGAKVPNLGLMNNQGDYAGTDAGRPRADSLKGDESVNINAEQKQAFEKTGSQGSGGNQVTGGARSQVAAATNSGNTNGGPGAGSVGR